MAGITVRRADPSEAVCVAMLDELSATLTAITGGSGRASFDPSDVAGSGGCFLAAESNGEAVGCGGLRPTGERGTAEIKRVYVRRPGQGIGRVLVAALEGEARGLGYTRVCLETRRCNTRAVAFYEALGYRVIENYGRYRGNDAAVCFGKDV